MKKILLLLLIFALSCSLFSCCLKWNTRDAETVHFLTIDQPDLLFNTVQGGTFDGEYFYVAFINKTLPTETAIIVKADMDGNVVKQSEILPLDHANSITLLENGDLMIAHCQSPDGHYYRYSILDKDTFEIIETKDLNEPFMSIAYCKEKQAFVGGEWNGDKMNVYGRDLQLLYSFEVDYRENTTPQSYYCADDDIYAIRGSLEGVFHNYIYIFSYDGHTLLEYEMDLPGLCEAEAVSVIDNEIYVICGDYDKCEIYRITNLIQGE